jgi:hypothetical protein
MSGLDILDDLPDDELMAPEEYPAELVPKTVGELMKIADVEEELYREGLEILRGVQRFHKVSADQEGPSEEWILQFGKEQAEEMFRLALFGQMSSRNAPVGIRAAEHTVLGIAKARALQRVPPVLSLNFISMPAPVLPEMEVDD